MASAVTFAVVWIATTPAEPVAAATVAPSIWYGGCRDVRAAGKAPLLCDQPGYPMDVDGDGDGIVCEPRPHNSGDDGYPIG